MAKPPWSSCERIPLLGPDPIALCVGIVTVVAAFDATRPTHTPFGIDLLSAIQPVVVSGALDQEPRDSYFITWLSREQSGRRWLLKTSAEAIVIEILLNNELRGNPEQKLSGRPWRSALCATLTLPSELQCIGSVGSGS